MNKKGTGIIGGVLLFVMFVIVWVLVLASWINGIGQNMVDTNHLVGFEAFFYSNLNLLIFIVMCISLIVWGALSNVQ